MDNDDFPLAVFAALSIVIVICATIPLTMLAMKPAATVQGIVQKLDSDGNVVSTWKIKSMPICVESGELTFVADEQAVTIKPPYRIINASEK